MIKSENYGAREIVRWLKANGLACGVLTGTDVRALAASCAILDVMCVAGRDSRLLDAYALTVSLMQPKAIHLAYHAIAMVMDWGERSVVFAMAGLSLRESLRQGQHAWPLALFEPRHNSESDDQWVARCDLRHLSGDE